MKVFIGEETADVSVTQEGPRRRRRWADEDDNEVEDGDAFWTGFGSAELNELESARARERERERERGREWR